jgi:dephospho-CoA kinase
MKVLGLTGSIGMGKSTAAKAFGRLRVPVFDADATVHRLQGPGGAAVRPIEAAFPGTTREGRVDRAALRAVVLADPAARKRLERIVWPLVRQAERAFLAAARRRGARIAVLDIPLLLETGGEKRVDEVIVVSAPASVQRSRVLARGSMSPAQFAAIRAAQMPDALKRRRADRVVRTGLSRHEAQRHIRAIVRELRG